LAIAAVLTATPASSWAGGESPSSSASAAAAPAGAPPQPPQLQPLPRPRPGPPAPQDPDQLLERPTSAHRHTGANARDAVNDAAPSVVAAIRHRVQDIRGTLDRDAAPRVLEDARKAGRKAMKASAEGKPKKGEDEEGDWLEFMLATAHPKDGAW